MFKGIESLSTIILDNLNADHVPTYDWLQNELKSKDVSSDNNYQKKYRYYWVMRYISPQSEFNEKYFKFLEENKTKSTIDFVSTCEYLSQYPSDSNGNKKSFQFSFITKLIHSIDNNFPIYDSMVASFFNLPAITGNSLATKIKTANSIITDLQEKYSEAIANNYLSQSISNFRTRFPSSTFSDRKIIDTMIWAYVSKIKT